MPIVPPALDDRRFEDLVEELLARIPAHTPEWSNPRPGDPGRTLIELFAWLADTLLYRANLIPERQRLAFLRLLGLPLRSAVAARGLIGLTLADDTATASISLQPLARVSGPAEFETRSELTVLPITAETYYKRPPSGDEARDIAPLLPGLRTLYDLSGPARPYVTTPVFPNGAAEPAGFDLIEQTVDRCLWLALLAPSSDLVEAVRETLGRSPTGGQQLLSVGLAPSIEVPGLFEQIAAAGRVPHVWEISGLGPDGAAEYHQLDLIADSSAGLTRRGILRLALPAARFIGAPSNDVRTLLRAGVGDQPPRLDAAETAERLVAWLRLRPTERLQSLSLSWVGINAVEIDQRTTIAGRIVGQLSGAPDQELQLPGRSIEVESLRIEVEESGRGFQPWRRIDDLALAGPDDPVYSLDPEAGTVRFGDGLRGRLGEPGRRVRLALMRAGGGLAGNLPAGSLQSVSARDLNGAPVPGLKLQQSLPTDGGEDGETLAQAERRIPALFRHRDRAVTEEDYRRLAVDAPGVRVSRVEVLPGFKPHQRRADVPGVVSVLVLPFKPTLIAPNPRPDRPFLETVHRHLDERRPLTTELYVIGTEYVELGVSVGISVLDGAVREAPSTILARRNGSATHAVGLGSLARREGRPGAERETILTAVREALRRYLWPLVPGGVDGTGWPLGRQIRARELEVVVARVPGVDTVGGVNLFVRRGRAWQRLPAAEPGAAVLRLEPWQLPELLTVVVVADDEAPTDLRGAPDPFAEAGPAFAVPVVPEIC